MSKEMAAFTFYRSTDVSVIFGKAYACVQFLTK